MYLTHARPIFLFRFYFRGDWWQEWVWSERYPSVQTIHLHLPPNFYHAQVVLHKNNLGIE